MEDFLAFMPEWLNFTIRMLYAALCGFVVGFERKSRSKEAGIRTHTIVALGACLMMIISKYAFRDAVGNSDGARVAAQIVSGIGFLGTGMIVYSKGTLHGLTTAAGIWATAGVGMAIGAGGNVMFIVGTVATALIVLVHLFLHLPLSIFKSKSYHQIQVQFVVGEGVIDQIKQIFKARKVYRMKMQSDGVKSLGTILLKTSDIPMDNEWQIILEKHPFILSMEYHEEEWQ